MIIEQGKYSDLCTNNENDTLFINQGDDSILINTKGAKQLIKVLQEFVDENN